MNLFESEGACVLYDVDGTKIDPEIENRLHLVRAKEPFFDIFTVFFFFTHHLLKNKQKIFVQCMKSAEEKKRVRKATKQPDISLLSALREALAEYEAKYGKLSPMDHRILNWRVATLEGAVGGDSSLMSLNEWNQDEEHEFKGSPCLIREGYGNVLNCLAQGLDIRLGHRVSRIEYDAMVPKCRIHTLKGVIEADKILVTLPLGVLKTG
jgi:hypothetical protein